MYVNILNKKVAVCTLGCKVNQYESDSMMDILKKNGIDVTVRRKFGNKISAACGQLRSKEV